MTMMIDIYRDVECFIIYCTQLTHILFQSHWIGKEYYKRGPNGNDIQKTNVPHIRLEFRDTVRKITVQNMLLAPNVIILILKWK